MLQKFLTSAFCLLALAVVSCSDDNLPDLYKATGNDDPLPSNGLPVIDIRTSDGMAIKDKTEWREASITVHGGDDFSSFTSPVTVKGRGNSTFKYPKTPFTLKFPERKKLLGMKSARRWVFLANYRDRTLLRNDVSFRIGDFFGNLEWTPRGEFVDLVFNGHYVGNYYVCEKVEVDKHRLAITEMKEENPDDDITGGYLLQLDNVYDEPNRFKTKECNLPVGIISPDEDACTESHKDYIEAYINTLEQLLVSGSYDQLYSEYLDLPSFVDYYIVEALVGNNDFRIPRSAYVYKKRDGKLFAGPLWDFDYSTFFNKNELLHEDAWWYAYLLKDNTFRDAVARRINQLHDELKECIPSYIEEKKNYIFHSAIENERIFPFEYATNANNVYDTSFLISISRMNEVFEARLELLSNRFPYKGGM